MFLRIKNRAEVTWAFRQSQQSRPATLTEPEFEEVLGSDLDETAWERRLLAPVDMNPSLDHVSNNNGGTVSVYIDRSRTSNLTRRRRLTEQELGQLSVAKGFFSDPHCAKIQVDLFFTLGVRLPTHIDVSSFVTSSEPLTIERVITKALN
jgi:hypothetical protein